MRLVRSIVLVLLAGILCAGSTLADERDSVWFVVDQDKWEINSESDSIGPVVHMWALSDWDPGDPLRAVSSGFEVKFDTTGFTEDPLRWHITYDSFQVHDYYYYRTWSSIDSHIVIDTFILNSDLEADVKPSAHYTLDTTLGTGAAYGYNGYSVGLIAFGPPIGSDYALPDATPTWIGDIHMRMHFEFYCMMPDSFNIVIDSAWFPPSGKFKFTRKNDSEGTPPRFGRLVIPVVAAPELPMDADDTDPDALIPTSYGLRQNYPNPFNPTTTISYSLESRGFVEISIYNVRGQRVRTLVSYEHDAGSHKVVWDGKNESGKGVSSGMYFYKMTSGDHVSARKMLLLK